MATQKIASLASAHSARFPRHAFRYLVQALALRRNRHALTRLDTHLLRDIGLTRAEADAEATRPIWDVPDHWLK